MKSKMILLLIAIVLVSVALFPSVASAGTDYECSMWYQDCMANCGPGPSACKGVCHQEYVQCLDSTLC